MVLITIKRNLIALVILVWALGPLIIQMLLLQTFTARYLLFSIPPLILLGGWFLDYLVKEIIPKSVKSGIINKLATPLILFIILSPTLYFNILLLKDPLKAPLPREERRGYLEDWTAGYGLKEIAQFLSQKAIDRRAKSGITIKAEDLPVNQVI